MKLARFIAQILIKRFNSLIRTLATWEDTDAKVKLSIDWAKLGLDPSKVTLHAPAIENFQQETTWKPGDEIVVPKGKGLLIIAK